MKAAACAVLLALAAVLAAPAAQAGPEVTLLLHHPYPDYGGADPFGFSYQGGDAYFFQLYAPLAKDQTRFDYPFFVADGILPIVGPVNASQPFASAQRAYEGAVASRLGLETPVALRLATVLSGSTAVLAIGIDSITALPGEHLHLRVALAEDPVHFLGPPNLNNGITDHRFTVRAIADLGEQAITTAPVNATHTFQLDDSWARDRLVVAAWLQQDAPGPRFDAREVVQATHVDLGGSVDQDSKGVLVEMLSATWCTPCLYGDLAVEAVAVAHGSAEPLEVESGPRYFQAPAAPLLAALAAVVAGLAVAWWGGRRA